MSSRFWFIPATWMAYYLGLAVQNAAAAATNKPILAYGSITSWWFIAVMLTVTVLLEAALVIYENTTV